MFGSSKSNPGNTIFRVCVFGSSSKNTAQHYVSEGQRLGKNDVIGSNAKLTE